MIQSTEKKYEIIIKDFETAIDKLKSKCEEENQQIELYIDNTRLTVRSKKERFEFQAYLNNDGKLAIRHPKDKPPVNGSLNWGKIVLATTLNYTIIKGILDIIILKQSTILLQNMTKNVSLTLETVDIS